VTGGFGFGAIPEELRQTAGKIDDAIGGVIQLFREGPTGDYGHSGVQRAWADFVENVKREVESLRDKAAEHGDSLRTAAIKYLEREAETGATLTGLGGLVDGGGLDPSVVPGGGITGGMGIGQVHSGQPIGAGLDPSVVPGGGITGSIADALSGIESETSNETAGRGMPS
jgi:hypothetical protein